MKNIDCANNQHQMAQRWSKLKLKVSKVSRHFAFFVNIFRNFNAINVFSFAMSFYGHEDNFQPTKI